jgi:hypothetical protein
MFLSASIHPRPEFRAALITTLATVGNPEALFHSGLCLAILGNKLGVIMTCLDQLRRAAEAGYKVSMYALVLFLYRPNRGDADDDEVGGSCAWLRELKRGRWCFL